MKKYSDVFTTIIVKVFNKCMHNGTFPKSYKILEIIPVYEKDKPCDKSYYRLLSMLSNLSKHYKRYMLNEINAYFHDILSKFQCGFGKGYSAQYRQLYMTEKIKKSRDSKGVFAAVFTDFSKSLDCISHVLLLAKLYAYGFDKISLTFMLAILSQRQ